MKERLILFNAPMVRTLLAGSKTQTRRIVKQRYSNCHIEVQDGWPVIVNTAEPEAQSVMQCPYGQPGDRLWVRETWQAVSGNDRARHIMTHPRHDRGWLEYAATPRSDEPAYKWMSSIHMPRWASRIMLEIVSVRVECLQDISEADAMAEGAPPSHPSIDRVSQEYGYADFSRSWYAQLWDHINGAGSWDLNPWVWVIKFKKLEQP